MKDKENLFALLRAAVETPAETTALEDFIRKVNREMPPIEVVDDTHKKFDGCIYHLNKRDGRYYFGTSLTRSVWKFFNGEIHAGYEVHHSDLNKYNDDISNLVLLIHAKHKKLHDDRRRGVKTFREPKPKNFVCKFCGKEFTALTTNGLRRYCSPECRQKSLEQCGNYRTERTCEVCGKKFTAYKGHPTTHCSEECVAKSLEKRESRHCPICGKDFETHTCHNQKYCSRECVALAMRKLKS